MDRFLILVMKSESDQVHQFRNCCGHHAMVIGAIWPVFAHDIGSVS
jgi:hypothetical protein